MYKPGTNIVAADTMSHLLPQENLQVPTPGCIIHQMDHLDDTTVDSADIRRCTSKNPVLSKVYQAVQLGTNLPEGPLNSAFHTKRYELSIKNGCLLWWSRMVIPHTLRQQFLKELYQCHLGMVKMRALARNYMWWPGIDADIEEKANHCYICQRSRTSLARAALHPWEWPRKHWQWIHVDYADYNGKNLFIVPNAHSKLKEVYLTGAINSITTIEKIRCCFTMHGLPNLFVSDNDLCFISLGVCWIY